MLRRSPGIIMLWFRLNLLQFFVQSCFSFFKSELFDLKLSFSLSSEMTFWTLSFCWFNFNFYYFLSHEIPSEHIFHDTKAGWVSSGQKTSCIFHPGQFDLNLCHLILSSRSKDLHDHSKSINHSDLPNTEVIIASVIRQSRSGIRLRRRDIILLLCGLEIIWAHPVFSIHDDIIPSLL